MTKQLTDEQIRQIAHKCWHSQFDGNYQCPLCTEPDGCTCPPLFADYYKKHFNKELPTDEEEYMSALYEIATTEVQ